MPHSVLIRHVPALGLGLCIYCNKIIEHLAGQNHTYECSKHTHECENHTHDCSNHKQSAKITSRVPKSYVGCQHHTHNVKITLVRVI
jgi:hypothetical protein